MTYSKSYLRRGSICRNRKLQILNHGEVQCLVRIILHLVSMHHIRSLHYNVQIRGIASIPWLVKHPMSWTMALWNGYVGLCRETLEGVRGGEREDVDEVSA